MARRFEPVSLGSPTFRSIEVGAFQITRARFPAGLVLPAHIHERACVATTLSGAWDSVLAGQPHACRPSTLLVEPAGDRHSNHFAVTTDVVVIQPDGRREDLFEPCRPLLERAQSFRDSGVGLLAHKLGLELDARDAAARLVVEGLALELVATATRGADPSARIPGRPQWIQRARERLHDGAVSGVSIADVAAEVGVHPVYLARVFRACYGTSPGSYARRVRLERAATRLVATDDALADVAQDAGFADQSHFTRAFRRHTGWTPAAFRRRMRE